MMKTLKKIVLVIASISASSITLAASPNIQSLQNMERERSALISVFVSAEMSPAERARKMEFSSRRLLDMERMVIRDDRLVGSRSPIVRKAFQNYDLTFLVHASVESDRHPMDYWLEQVGLSTSTITTSHSGRH